MESKRHRKEINYYADKSILSPRTHRTSDWTAKIVSDMHIRINDHSIFDLPTTYVERDINLACISDDEWRSIIDIKHLPLPAEYKTLVKEVKVVYDFDAKHLEYFIDTYVSTLFHVMKMNDYPLSINAQHELNVDIGEYEERIISIPDFIIRSEQSKMLVVVEDKTMVNAKYINQWRENQVMGEIFVAVHNMEISKPSELYAIRIIGTLFTFYKAFITPDYIKESLMGLPIEHYMDVHRYPPPGTDTYQINALDFCKLEHRKIIIEYLSQISDALKC
jgi:hypothetical protein